MKQIVLVTGGFDPIHSGHIAYFDEAKKIGDILIVGINSDSWLARKKGSAFMHITDRKNIVKNLKMVDGVIIFDDQDDSAKDAIRIIRKIYPTDKIIFANGGDRTEKNIPEMDVKDENLEFIFGVGGPHKINSSSIILKEWKACKTKKSWGYYRVLDAECEEVKVKELTVDPGKRLSMQRHQKRSELWFVVTGTARVYTFKNSPDYELIGEFKKHQFLNLFKDQWHMLANETDHPLKIVEIQYGEKCTEQDIERL
jgi:cytidyltransferase-like protein